MYGRGKDYFSYIDGLPLPADKISGLLKTLGAPSIAPATLEELGGKIQASGVLPALNLFMPSIVVDVLMATYPDVFPSVGNDDVSGGRLRSKSDRACGRAVERMESRQGKRLKSMCCVRAATPRVASSSTFRSTSS